MYSGEVIGSRMHCGRGDPGSWLVSFDVFGDDSGVLIELIWSFKGRLVAGWVAGGLVWSFSSYFFSIQSLPGLAKIS